MIQTRDLESKPVDSAKNEGNKSVITDGFDLTSFKNNPVPNNVWLQLASYLPVEQVTKVAHFVSLLGAKVKSREKRFKKQLNVMIETNASPDLITAFKKENDPDILKRDDLMDAGNKAFGKAFVDGFVDASGDFATIVTYLGRYFSLPDEAMALIEMTLIGRITDE